MKVTIYILDRRLRADGLKSRRVPPDAIERGLGRRRTSIRRHGDKLEDAILTRARELRLASERTGG